MQQMNCGNYVEAASQIEYHGVADLVLNAQWVALLDRFSALDLPRGQIDSHYWIGPAFASESPRIKAVTAS
jgi:hypothetical protein